MSNVSYVVKNDVIQVLVGSEMALLTPSHPMFDLVKRTILENNLDELPRLVSLTGFVSSTTNGEVTFKDGKLYYKGQRLNSELEDKLLSKAYRKDIDGMVQSVINFKTVYDILGEEGVEDLLAKLKLDPNKRAEDLFYDWLLE